MPSTGICRRHWDVPFKTRAPRAARRLPRLRWSSAHVSKAADSAAELLEAVTTAVMQRAIPGEAAPRRKCGRGSQLPPAVQCAVMYHAGVLGHGTRTIARTYGMHRSTVQKVLATSTYQEFRKRVIKWTLDRLLDDDW